MVFNEVANGGLSSKEATAKIKALGEEGDEFMERKEKLNEDMTPEKLEEIAEIYSDEFQTAFKNMLQSAMKAQQSGRMTEELRDAFMNMNAN